jgi:hypothetical protein
MEEKIVNRKNAMCYTFQFAARGNKNEVCYAVKTHFVVEKEGPKEDFFDALDLEDNQEEEDFKRG